jgi:hypothetical protein
LDLNPTHSAVLLPSILPKRWEYPGNLSRFERRRSQEVSGKSLGVGVSWGDGTLTYRGKQHKFSLEGLSLVDLGASKVSAKGEVSDLKKLEDFSGTYTAAGAGAAAGGGAGVVALTNQNGVKMKLQATAQGVRLTAAGAGVTIKLKN